MKHEAILRFALSYSISNEDILEAWLEAIEDGAARKGKNHDRIYNMLTAAYYGAEHERFGMQPHNKRKLTAAMKHYSLGIYNR